LLESCDESILCEVLGQADIAHNPRQSGNEPRRLDPPDRVDGMMCVGGHCYRSHHASSRERKWTRSVPRPVHLPGFPRLLFNVLCEVLRTEYLANLGLALPSGPLFPVKLHEAYRRVDRLLLRFQFELPVAADGLQKRE
jgi:hypothetical protein